MSDSRFTAVIAAVDHMREQRGLDMRGKLYSMVKDRIEVFRREFGDEYGIDTSLDYSRGFGSGQVIVAKAKIKKGNDVLASGHAMEFIGSSEVSSTSAIEACETSAIGRALACFGLAGGEYPSGDEMAGVSRKQEAVVKYSEEIMLPRAQQAAFQSVPEMPEGNGAFYVPKEPFAAWVNLLAEVQKVESVVEGVSDKAQLGHYWTELKPLTEALKQHEPGLLAQLKAAFAVRNRQLN